MAGVHAHAHAGDVSLAEMACRGVDLLAAKPSTNLCAERHVDLDEFVEGTIELLHVVLDKPRAEENGT